MFDLYSLPRDVPFPRTLIASGISYDDLRDIDFTRDEIRALINEKTVERDGRRYQAELAPKFLEDLGISILIREHGGRMTAAEIAEELNIQHDHIRQILCRAINKMKSMKTNIDLLHDIAVRADSRNAEPLAKLGAGG